MKITTITSIATTYLLIGCSPKLTTEMTTQALEPKATSEVMILGHKDTIPTEARSIGTLKIKSRLSSLQKSYTRILNLAVKETAQRGGNMLVVDYSDMEKNTLKGTMAYFDGETNSALTLSPNRVKQLLVMGTQQNQPALQTMSKEQEQKEQPDSTIKAASFEDESSYFGIKEDKDSRKGVIKLSGGPMWTTSKFYLTNDGSDYLSNVRGTAFDLSLHSIEDLWGYGFDLYGSQTKVTIGNYWHNTSTSYNFFYAGPNLVMGGTFAKHFYADISAGIGMGYYHDSGSDEIGFGMRESVGLGVMLNDRFSVGIDAAMLMATFQRPDGFNLPDNESYGLKFATVMLTLRAHL